MSGGAFLAGGLLAAVLAVTLVSYLRSRRQDAEVQQLRAQYLRALHRPRGIGEELMLRQLEDLHDRFPGKPMAWYLRSLLTQLEKDRSR